MFSLEDAATGVLEEGDPLLSMELNFSLRAHLCTHIYMKKTQNFSHFPTAENLRIWAASLRSAKIAKFSLIFQESIFDGVSFFIFYFFLFLGSKD